MVEKEEKATQEISLQTKITWGIVGVIVLAALASSLYFYRQYQKSQQLLQNPTLAQQEQNKTLLTQVGKLIELPKDETPTIATVSDVTKLQGQPFFSQAKNGDKVLIYAKNKKAILYDPVANIIVDVAPVNIGSTTPTVSPTPTLGIHVVKATPTPTK